MFGLNGNAVVLSTWTKPVSTPVLPTWFEIHTYGGGPVNTPVPPRTCVVWLPLMSQLKPTRGDQSGVEIPLGLLPVRVGEEFGCRERCGRKGDP